MQEQRNVVLENINLFKHLPQKLLNAVAREDFVYPRRLASLHHTLLALRFFSVKDGFYSFFLRNRENGRPDIERINIIDKKVELSLLSVFAGFRLVVVHRENHLLILVIAEVIVIPRVVTLPEGDDLLHKANGGVFFLTVFLFLRFDNHFVQGDAARSQPDVQLISSSGLDRDIFRIVTEIGNLQRAGIGPGGERKCSVFVCRCSDGRSFKDKGHVRQSFARDGIGYTSFDYRILSVYRRYGE